MILQNDFASLNSRQETLMKCDYCELEFYRKKSQVLRGRKIVKKDCCLNKLCVSKKRKESNLEKYGTNNPMQNEVIKSKQISSLMENYGVTSPSKNQEIKQKIKETNLNKYGNICAANSDISREKSKETCRKKYGTDHPFSSSLIREKSNRTMNEKYGCHYTQTEDFKLKTKETCNKKYGKGIDHSSQSELVKDKKKKTNQIKYGCDFPSQNEEIIRKIFEDGNQRKNYGKTENEIKEYLQEISNYEFNSTMIDKKQIDIFNNELKFGIEYCGLFWHNENSPEPRDRNYHYNKYKACEAKGIRLLTIFEDEWIHRKNQCKNFIKSSLGIFSQKIYARKCKIESINNKCSNEFYNKYHILGSANNTKKTFCLIYENDIVGMISLGYHHRNSSKTTINRLCFKENFQIIGGASKLISSCINWCIENGIKEIITWSDNRWSIGNVYNKLGFRLDKEMKPDYSYVDLSKKFKRVSKQSKKNKEKASLTKLAKIWDCGKKRWIFDNYLLGTERVS